MPRESTLGWTGYVGLSLLAALVTLGVMLILFTDGGSSSMRIEVGDVLVEGTSRSTVRIGAYFAGSVVQAGLIIVVGLVGWRLSRGRAAYGGFQPQRT